MAAVTLLSIPVVALQKAGRLRFHEIAALPFSLIGVALSIFAGFRNSACDARWWWAARSLASSSSKHAA